MNSEEKRIQSLIEKAGILSEALPYIRKFSGTRMVIKYGGSAMKDPELLESTLGDIALLKLVGLDPILVHGGGPAISEMLERLGIESKFHRGLRITDEQTMEVSEMVLSGKVNKLLARRLSLHGVEAVGISGEDARLFTARKKTEPDLGFVGEITSVRTKLIETLLESDYVPIIAPVSAGEDGKSYNINADDAALAVASALGAEKLVYLSDVPGVLTDPENPQSLLTSLNPDDAGELIADGTVSGGMVPKVQRAVDAVSRGVESVHILDGRLSHSLLLEIFTEEGVGTLIHKEMTT